MLTTLRENEYGAVFHSDSVPNSLFNFYVLRRRLFVDGTARWNICCELKNNNARFLVIDTIKGTKEDAIRKLEDILSNSDDPSQL